MNIGKPAENLTTRLDTSSSKNTNGKQIGLWLLTQKRIVYLFPRGNLNARKRHNIFHAKNVDNGTGKK